jgi:peptide subunit release factor 1 (eRF1)
VARPALSHDVAESLRRDLHKVRHFVQDEFRRDGANGLAIFSCAARDLWQVVRLPAREQTRTVFQSQPYVAPLATFLNRARPTAVLLTDRQYARIFSFGERMVKEWTDFGDFVPRRTEQGGWSQMRYQRRSDEWAEHHLDHAAQLVLSSSSAGHSTGWSWGRRLTLSTIWQKTCTPMSKIR